MMQTSHAIFDFSSAWIFDISDFRFAAPKMSNVNNIYTLYEQPSKSVMRYLYSV